MFTQNPQPAQPIPTTSQAEVSIIIPCYNGAQFLADAIDSALQQTFAALEIIIVDDGSKDSTPLVAKGYGARIRYIFQENAGLSAARNTGIEVASCAFVLFLDADDRLLPQMVDTMVRTLRALPQEFALIACDSDLIDSNGNPMARKFRPAARTGELTAKDLILMNRFPCTVVAKRDVFATCGLFDTTLKSSEDRDMWIRIASRYRIQLLPQSLVQIRRHGQNMSGNAARQSRNMRKVLKKAFERGSVSRFDILFWSKALSIYFFQSGFMFAETGSRLAASASFLCSLCLRPFFLRPSLVNQPPWFRIRRLLRIGFEILGWRVAPQPAHGTMVRSESPAENMKKASSHGIAD